MNPIPFNCSHQKYSNLSLFDSSAHDDSSSESVNMIGEKIGQKLNKKVIRIRKEKKSRMEKQQHKIDNIVQT